MIVEAVGALEEISLFDVMDMEISDDDRTNEAFRNMLYKRKDDIFKLECFYWKQKKFE